MARPSFDSVSPWLLILIAGVLEIVWAAGIKQSQGFTRLWPSIWTLAAMIVSFWLLARGVRHLPIGTAYAVWTGIGAAGTAIVGMVLLGESTDLRRILCLVLIISGIVGLKWLE